MKFKSLFICAVIICSRNSFAQQPAPKPSAGLTAAAQPEQESRVLAEAIADPWHFGFQVTQLNKQIAQALAIVQSASKQHTEFQSSIAPVQQKLKKLSDEMEPRMQHLADAQKIQSTFAPTLISTRKAHLTDSLLGAVGALNEVVALQDGLIKATVMKNKELEAILSAKS